METRNTKYKFSINEILFEFKIIYRFHRYHHSKHKTDNQPYYVLSKKKSTHLMPFKILIAQNELEDYCERMTNLLVKTFHENNDLYNSSNEIITM